MKRWCSVGIAAIGAVVLSGRVLAGPWLAPGDEGLRADIQLLADTGILPIPITTWPISWPDVAQHVSDPAVGDIETLDDAQLAALDRVRRAAHRAAAKGFSGIAYRASVAEKPARIRGFSAAPREEGEAQVQTSWLSDHFALNVSATVVADPDDGKRIRADGSYLGINIGNYMVSAGYMDRWWGPGWEGSLILSTNARPVPAFMIERNHSDRFENPLLRWLGPWRAVLAVGALEESGVATTKARFFAARVNFKPRPWLEMGLSRTAQWCGGGRDCGWSTFGDMLLGRDNEVDPANPDAQPGNQLAGYDLRVTSPWRRVPVAVYSQWIGEDEAGGLPAKFMGQLGLETWTSFRAGSLRAHVEFADTTCSFTRSEPDFNCAYRNALYPQGYAYRGRTIGHTIDNDSRIYSLGAQFHSSSGAVTAVRVSRIEVNRDGTGGHPIAGAPLEISDVELRHSRALGVGKFSVGAGIEDASARGGSGSEARGYITWQQGFE